MQPRGTDLCFCSSIQKVKSAALVYKYNNGSVMMAPMFRLSDFIYFSGIYAVDQDANPMNSDSCSSSCYGKNPMTMSIILCSCHKNLPLYLQAGQELLR